VKRAGFSLLILSLAAACQQPATAAEPTVQAPVAARPAREVPGLKTAVFAGGCFWGIEGVFSHVAGVTSVVRPHRCPACNTFGLSWEDDLRRAICMNRRCLTKAGTSRTWSLARIAYEHVIRQEKRQVRAT
jgi:hypothetical protein